ncbi:hyaluronan-mediated motility receptor-like [Oscarella lobularis]|uniref:hyaluronan-mediated motility receptor-like n=1 Tax=Oscarella lobularis TaxID=121494 RepID=UPI00331353F7
MTLKDSFEEERRERCEICLAIMHADTDKLKAIADPFDVVLGNLQNLVDENSSLKVENQALLDASSSTKRELTETLSLLTVEREKREDARSEVRQLESDMEELEGRLASDRSQHRASVAGSTLACEKLKEKLDKQQSQFQLEHEKIMNEANGLKMKTVELEQSVSLVTSVKNELASQVVEAENRFDLVCKELSRLLASGLTVCESDAEEPASDDEKINLIRKQIREFRENAKVEILKWKSLYEELKETHEGGLVVKKAASSGAASLEAQHADMMGHRNPKQKIHYVQRLREENKALKAEVQRLQTELEKRKRQVWKLRSFSRDEPSSPSKGKK